MATKTIKQRVADADAELKAMTTTEELRAWAVEQGMDNQSAFPRFKAALLEECGVDYDALRTEAREAARETAAASVTHEVVLYSDAKASKDRYAICGPDGKPLWHGRFFDSDRDYDGEQSSGELSAAKKAIWLAGQMAKHLGPGTGLRLELKVDAEWLTWANNTDGRGGKAQELTRAAARAGIVLHVTHIPGTSNPADPYTVAQGFMKYQDSGYLSLPTSVA